MRRRCSTLGRFDRIPGPELNLAGVVSCARAQKQFPTPYELPRESSAARVRPAPAPAPPRPAARGFYGQTCRRLRRDVSCLVRDGRHTMGPQFDYCLRATNNPSYFALPDKDVEDGPSREAIETNEPAACARAAAGRRPVAGAPRPPARGAGSSARCCARCRRGRRTRAPARVSCAVSRGPATARPPTCTTPPPRPASVYGYRHTNGLTCGYVCGDHTDGLDYAYVRKNVQQWTRTEKVYTYSMACSTQKSATRVLRIASRCRRALKKGKTNSSTRTADGTQDREEVFYTLPLLARRRHSVGGYLAAGTGACSGEHGTRVEVTTVPSEVPRMPAPRIQHRPEEDGRRRRPRNLNFKRHIVDVNSDSTVGFSPCRGLDFDAGLVIDLGPPSGINQSTHPTSSSSDALEDEARYEGPAATVLSPNVAPGPPPYDPYR
ncbi:hypothetical protein EVAR_40846_1 [Eumeta japonica]|uniref:Uncharacterized protein n=1 Tax=Eumeta variegata TaxID=151549 RepID=A0A4C1ZU42_EUMVA|nr:hypothetical protein EVAR_40846_1 [Eumeta japonica]